MGPGGFERAAAWPFRIGRGINKFLIGGSSVSFSAMAFGRGCRVIAERVHADKEGIRNYEFQKSGGNRWVTVAPISAASFGGMRGY